MDVTPHSSRANASRLTTLERFRAAIRRFYNYRSIRLTSDGTRFVVLTLAVGVAAINTGNNLLYLLLAMMLSLIVISGMLSEQCLKHLDVRRRLPEHIFANRPTTASLIIANRKRRFPTFSLRVMDWLGRVPIDRGIHILHLPARASALRTYPLLVPRRGVYRLDGVKLLTPFPFGLFMKAATLPLPCEVVVYPEIRPLPEFLLQDLAALGHEQAVSQRGQGVALYNLRPYQAGDESRTIHWKTSARQGRLIVKETEAEDLRRVTLALSSSLDHDALGSSEHARPERGHYDQQFEQAVIMTASLVTFFHERGYAVRLLVGDQEIQHGVGARHYYVLLRALGLCRLTSSSGSGTLSPAFRSLRGGSGELSLLIMPWPDPRLTNISRQVSKVIQI
jgi:uncharacterized protein (DUF58 family)